MPNAYGRAFTTANFLTNLAALKAINFGASDPMGCWFVVPNSSTNNVEIWVWEPASTATTNEIDVIRPDSIVPGSPGRCLQRLKFDASTLGGVLAAIASLNTAGLIERTADGSASIVGLGSFARSFLGSATNTAARTALALNLVNNTSDLDKPISSAQQSALDLKANLSALNSKADLSALTFKADLASPTFTGTVGGITAAMVGLGNVTNTSDANKPVSTAQQSALNLKADLVGGFVPSSQLPSYVDDVLEFATLANFPATGESGKIYVTSDTNITYRWSGSAYVEISASLALGTTSNTAYRGDFGNTAYLHSQSISNPHGVTKAQVGLGNLIDSLQLTASNNLSDLLNRQTALNTLAGGVTSGNFVRGNGTNIALLPIQSSDIPASISGNKTFTGTINISDTTPSTSTTTGALIVGGGIAGASLWVTGSIRQSINYTFRAAISASQSIPAATFTKINLTSEVTDSNNQYTAASARLVANTTETWELFIFITFNLATSARILLSIYKNGSESGGLRVMDMTPVAGFFGIPVTIPEINLIAGDYLEIFCYIASSQNVYGDATLGATYWSGKRIN